MKVQWHFSLKRSKSALLGVQKNDLKENKKQKTKTKQNQKKRKKKKQVCVNKDFEGE